MELSTVLNATLTLSNCPGLLRFAFVGLMRWKLRKGSRCLWTRSAILPGALLAAAAAAGAPAIARDGHWIAWADANDRTCSQLAIVHPERLRAYASPCTTGTCRGIHLGTPRRAGRFLRDSRLQLYVRPTAARAGGGLRMRASGRQAAAAVPAHEGVAADILKAPVNRTEARVCTRDVPAQEGRKGCARLLHTQAALPNRLAHGHNTRRRRPAAADKILLNFRVYTCLAQYRYITTDWSHSPRVLATRIVKQDHHVS